MDLRKRKINPQKIILCKTINMADLHSVLKYYQTYNVDHLGEVWNKLHKKGPSSEFQRDLIMFYFHHKNFPPLMQISCDSLFSSLGSKSVAKKQKNVICQIIEEVSVYLESSIVEQITLSIESVPINLLNCVLVGGLVCLLDEPTVDKLFRALKHSETGIDDRGKILQCLLGIHENRPTLISADNLSRLGMLMNGWFRHDHNKASGSSSGLFGRSDSSVATEVDGTNAREIYTVLTLVNNPTVNHMMAIHSFSVIREWLDRRFIQHNAKLTEFLREYLGLIVEQCFRPANKEHDRNLQKAVLCEIVDLMNQLVQQDISQAPLCLITIKRIQNNVMEHFRGNYNDVFIFTRILTFFLNFGQCTGYNSQALCEYFLNDMIHLSYSSGLSALEIVGFLVENNGKMDKTQKVLLCEYFPNILKIVACHPCVVIEEIVMLVPALVSPENAVEMFSRFIDLPLLSATLCLHQAPTLIQTNDYGSMDTQWSALLHSARTPEFIHSFNYLICNKAGGNGAPKDRLAAYMKLMSGLRCHNLVITCSQIVPLICDTMLAHISLWKDVAFVTPVVQVMLRRLELIFNVPDYLASIQRCVLKHIKSLFRTFPSLIFALQEDISNYISSQKNYEKFPQLYTHLIYAIGEFSCSGEINSSLSMDISQYYDVLECIIYERFALAATSEPVSLQLLSTMCSALSKLAAKCQDQISRAVLCLNKIRSHYLKTACSDCTIVCDRIEELLHLLQNPSIAAMVWSSSVNPSMTPFVQVLGHITDS